ncbi:thiamine biosynthesis lipoprotein [Andreprevotia lacus DSM 23236]|jgi:thiamine biosynthesis lipoprotein|uniref:FAD:protein FMN transferase n=1 Tax=Andreprevotia lacus DSM 23236 TaxID=1121001 RepID=A0A1W1X9D5_9NEIS|nr:FAD:protein FMN transferase [Andreprevotia lacus]SMC20592.1 thiamine biosynthesis lipoprotein [Andreprevotia lacus DSM 23236]
MRHVLIPPALAALSPRRPTGTIHALAGQTMGTSWSVKLVGPADLPLDAVRAGVEAELDLVVAQMSTWRADSDLSRFNAAQAGSWHVLPAPCFTVLQGALTVAEASAGAFDPTVGPLVNLWGFGPEGARGTLPTAAELDAARARCGWQRLTVDAPARRVQQPGGLYLDFSGIAKGYGADRVAAWLHANGLIHHLVEVGGELVGHGMKPDVQPWWVALEQPPGATLAQYVVALHGVAVATSGDYRRSFEHAGRHYAHTLDPRSGEPVLDAPASVTVLHADCMLADAWATALTVLGTEAGMQLAAAQGLAALFITRNAAGYTQHLTPTLESWLE